MEIVKIQTKDFVAHYPLESGESVSIYRCPKSNALFGVDSSWLADDEAGLMISPFDANIVFDFDEEPILTEEDLPF